MEALQQAVVDIAQTPWVLLAVLLLSFIDGFFPPVPSESIIIAVAALSVSGEGGPPMWLLIPVAALGAFCGDQVAYTIGRALPVHRIPGMRGPGGVRAMALATRALQRRGTIFIISARFVPGGRIAVNMAAGAIGYARMRFMIIDAVAVVMWASYSTLLGIGAGAVLHDHPLIAVVVGVLGGVLLGALVDRLIEGVQARFGSVVIPPPIPNDPTDDENAGSHPEAGALPQADADTDDEVGRGPRA